MQLRGITLTLPVLDQVFSSTPDAVASIEAKLSSFQEIPKTPEEVLERIAYVTSSATSISPFPTAMISLTEVNRTLIRLPFHLVESEDDFV